MNSRNSLRREEYRIGWISALKGPIGIHNVVLTCLPEGRYGTNFAAMIGFMNDIRLGDVIVSRPEREHGGVVQYNMGKYTVDGLLAVLNIMPEHDEPLPRCRTATYPGAQLDRLFRPTYKHVTSDQTCIDCSETETLKRGPGNREAGPHVYYGTIASGNMVIKDAGARDLLVQKHGVLCFEMEAAGLMNTNFPCLVIRGVSDYADSHKNDSMKYRTHCALISYGLHSMVKLKFLGHNIVKAP
ncbi:nucleoside phosphorylase domain-containing protein [Aspergillus arachidicola]|uniref:Nucleoside phosphorylase domain-containing protein n=1 Tax=Aspergillus arachidicola TaxID=656916 RepID=A0A5N6YGW9_9EURO|nr:nucleoside phosphorylase domain-containing protein [Aspergillus arachidicola]